MLSNTQGRRPPQRAPSVSFTFPLSPAPPYSTRDPTSPSRSSLSRRKEAQADSCHPEASFLQGDGIHHGGLEAPGTWGMEREERGPSCLYAQHRGFRKKRQGIHGTLCGRDHCPHFVGEQTGIRTTSNNASE